MHRLRAIPLSTALLAAALLPALFVTGCTATRVRPGADAGKPMQLAALLPPEYPRVIQRERVDAVWGAVREEIENSGYRLLDTAVVSRACGADPDCTEGREELVRRYGVEGFFRLALSSASRSNFIAGYYNSISGDLSLLDPDGREIVVVEHSERERGGLLFNTGQLAQGIFSQVENADEDESQGYLAGRFAQGITARLPKPADQPESVETARIENVTLQPLPEGFRRVCVRTSGEGSVFLRAGRFRTNLREMPDGDYCGAYRLADFSPRGAFEVEYRTPFGDSDRRPLELALEQPCPVAEAVKVQPRENGHEISVDCDSGAVMVYRAPGPAGPFRKIRETKAARVLDTSSADGTDPVYAVVAVTKDGDNSVPVVVR